MTQVTQQLINTTNHKAKVIEGPDLKGNRILLRLQEVEPHFCVA